jgi:hypothetical protein
MITLSWISNWFDGSNARSPACPARGLNSAPSAALLTARPPQAVDSTGRDRSRRTGKQEA